MEQNLSNDKSNICKIYVKRPIEEIDVLHIKITPNEIISKILKNLEYVYYKKKTDTYIFKIYFTHKLCYALLMSGEDVDMSELSEWNDLVLSWNDSYKMVNLNDRNLMFTPYKFQLDDISTMLARHTMLNGNDMGCGKTFESVAIGTSINKKKLVICPATLRLNWEYEIKMVTPSADISIIYNDTEFRIGNDWTIIGYTSLEKYEKQLINECFQCIFIDEAHFCKAINSKGNPDSIRARIVLTLAATCGYVYPITGTPKPTKNKDLFNILRMIKHPLAANVNSFFSYGVQYCNGKQTKYGWDYDGNSNDKELAALLKPYMIRHLKKDVLPHLKKIRKCIPVKINLNEYYMALNEYRELCKKKKSTMEQLQVLMRAKKTLATNKIQSTIEFAKEFVDFGEKIIIVTCFTEVVRRIEDFFSGNVVKIVGGMTDAKKNAVKQEFQTGQKQVMILNIEAGGVGITLTRAHNLIFNDYDWTVGNIIQAEDRICRGDQKEVCFIYFMTAKGAKEEEYFVNKLTYKSQSITDAVDGGTGEIIDFRTLVDAAM